MGKRSRNKRRSEGYYKLPRESRAAFALRSEQVVIGPCHECGHVRLLIAGPRLCMVRSCVNKRLKRIMDALEEIDAAEDAEVIVGDVVEPVTAEAA